MKEQEKGRKTHLPKPVCPYDRTKDLKEKKKKVNLEIQINERIRKLTTRSLCNCLYRTTRTEDKKRKNILENRN